MEESKSQKLPLFNSTAELVDFFDANDMGEYEEDMPEAHFDVNIKHNHYLISVDKYLMNKLLEIASEQQVSVEMLIDSWLKEKVLKVS